MKQASVARPDRIGKRQFVVWGTEQTRVALALAKAIIDNRDTGAVIGLALTEFCERRGVQVPIAQSAAPAE
jgi:hypothetical protein